MSNEPQWRAQSAEFYSWRAREYRRIADEATDPNLADLYRQLAVAFDNHAEWSRYLVGSAVALRR